MRTGILILLYITIIMETNAQNKQVDRQPVAAGKFYPAGEDALRRDISKLFEECKKSDEKLNVRAIVSPHAGYVFSGKISASAFSSVDKEKKISNVFVIASSHVMSFDGASVYNTGDYKTPLGIIPVNREIAEKLKKTNKYSTFQQPRIFRNTVLRFSYLLFSTILHANLQ